MSGTNSAVQKLLRDYQEMSHKELLRDVEDKREFLEHLGITKVETIESLVLGYDNGESTRQFSDAEIKTLKEMGLVHKFERTVMTNAMHLALKNEFGEIVGFIGIGTAKRGLKREWSRGFGLADWNSLRNGGEVTIAETLGCQLALYNSGCDSILTGPEHSISPEFIKVLRESGVKRINLVSIRNREVYVNALSPLDVDLYLVPVPRSNEEIGKGIWAEYLSKAEVIKKKSQNPLVEQNLNCEGQTFEIPEGTIQFTGLDMKDTRFLKGTIAIKTAQGVYRSQINLYDSDELRRVAVLASQKVNVDEFKLEEYLNHVTEKLEVLRSQKMAEEIQGLKKKSLYNAYETAHAESLATKNHLLQELGAIISESGFCGQAEEAELAILTIASSLDDAPLSLQLLGNDISRRRLFEGAYDLVPPSMRKRFGKLTQNALLYYRPADLEHVVFFIENPELVDPSFRLLQKRGTYTYAQPYKDPATGKMITEEIEVLGSIASIELYQADEDRDSNSSQILRIEIHASKAELQKTLSHDRQKASQNTSERYYSQCRVVQALLNSLKPYSVSIPFAGELERDAIPQPEVEEQVLLLSLIRYSTLLHQAQREKKQMAGVEYLEATLQDYEIAYRILSKLQIIRHKELSPRSIRLMDLVKNHVFKIAQEEGLKPEEFRFRSRDVRDWTNWPAYAVKESLKELVDFDLLELKSKSRQGAFHTYVLTQRDYAKANKTLPFPKPEELALKVGETGSKVEVSA